MIDKFAQIALASNESTSRRIEATKAIGKIAGEITTPFEVKEQAVNAVTNIAMSHAAPDEVRKAAAEIVTRIKSVTSEQFTVAIAKEVVERKINEIVIHHSAEPSISTYKGPGSIIKMAESQMAIRKWSKISWHYAIAPDGMIWLGMPLNVQATHAANHNDDSISVLLVIDGDKETPTEFQSRAMGILLRDLLEKFQLSAEENFSENKGFHRDYYPRKSCPGNNLTKELILNSITEARRFKLRVF